MSSLGIYDARLTVTWSARDRPTSALQRCEVKIKMDTLKQKWLNNFNSDHSGVVTWNI
jgi:hypothetical protein